MSYEWKYEDMLALDERLEQDLERLRFFIRSHSDEFYLDEVCYWYETAFEGMSRIRNRARQVARGKIREFEDKMESGCDRMRMNRDTRGRKPKLQDPATMTLQQASAEPHGSVPRSNHDP